MCWLQGARLAALVERHKGSVLLEVPNSQPTPQATPRAGQVRGSHGRVTRAWGHGRGGPALLAFHTALHLPCPLPAGRPRPGCRPRGLPAL